MTNRGLPFISAAGIRELNGYRPDEDTSFRPSLPIPHDARLDQPRCTMPVPCGVCWYCKQAVAK